MDYEPIRRLSDEVIGQIAAGEVVERPAAVVKELVENSIDAGASQVTVELKDGGVTYLRVSDNGKGIPAGQVKTAFERHTTSKLRTAEELYAVRTLGFRGEALASIAAVARVTCVTHAAQAEYGVKLQIEAGEAGAITEAASPQGTTITVRDLFFNTPVRLKFLKKAAAEAALVSDYIMRLILSRPDVAFRFVSQGKTVYRSAGDGTLESALYCVYGKDALRAMHRVQGVQAGIQIDGYVGVGELARGNRLQQSFFINGRYFRDEALSRALEFGCEGRVMIGRYPICTLMLRMPYQLVDVNVHPNKLQVRFQNPETVARAVEELTRDTLLALTMRERLFTVQAEEADTAEAQKIRMVPIEGSERAAADSIAPAQTIATSTAAQAGAVPITLAPANEQPELGNAGRITTSPALREPAAYAPNGEELLLSPPADGLLRETGITPDTQAPPPALWPPVWQGAPPMASDANYTGMPPGAGGHATAETIAPEAQLYIQPSQETFMPMGGADDIRYIGAVFQTYLLFEAGERLLLVDQHAAHERILYDRFMARYEAVAVSQRLLTPQLVRLTVRDVAQLADMDAALAEAGFAVEAFDETSVAVHALPVILGENESLRELLLDVLDEAQAARGKLTRERLRRRVTQMACKHAIKAGDALSDSDVRALLTQMLLTGAQPTCPHGRPIVSEITRRDLEKRFKRIQ